MSETAAKERVAVEATLLEEGGILRLVLDHPPGNVLSCALMEQLAAALAAHRERQELRLVLLRGAGGHFSYGASIEEHRREQAADLLATFHALVRDVVAYPVPVAALVDGRCLGAGFELVLCAQFLFATPGARFAVPEIKLGVFPPVAAALGHLRLGPALTEQLVLTGETVDGEAALRYGFLTALVGSDDVDPEEAVLAWYRKHLAPLSAYSLRQATRALREASGWLPAAGDALAAAERRYVEEVVPSHDGNEGIEAFLAKRPPRWRNAW